MKIVNSGTVDRMIWWKGTDTRALVKQRQLAFCFQSRLFLTYSETFDMAILMVNRKENATRTMFSYVVSFVNRK